MTHTTVSDVMTRTVVSVHADTPFGDVARTLAGHHINAVPVVDGDNRVTGVVSQTDLLRKLENSGRDEESVVHRFTHRAQLRKARGRIAADVMTSPAVTVPARASIVEAARLMDKARIKRLPVVDDLGRLAGVVSQGDLLKVFMRPDHEIRDEISKDVLLRQLCIRPTQVAVTVAHGVVELVGRLEQRSLVILVVELVGEVDGVVDVVNKLTYRIDDRLTPPTADRYRPVI